MNIIPQEILVIGLLILLEIALSVDNLAGMREKLSRLPEKMRAPTSLAASLSGLGVRVALVLLLIQLGKLMDPYFVNTMFGSGRGVLLSFGGGFLIIKAISDLKQHLDKEQTPSLSRLSNQVPSLAEIVIYDALLSIDSVVAALALAKNLHLVVIAMVIAHVLLNIFWKQIDKFFVNRPSMMTLTLCFVMIVGIVSMVRILGVVLAEETLIIALGFALMVELLNGKALRLQAAVASEVAHERILKYSQKATAVLTDEQPLHELALAPATIDLFTPQTCNSCCCTTFSAFPFCMSCGYSETAETLSVRN